MPAREGPQDMLVVESAGGSFGVLVDSVGEVLTVSSADFEPNPSTVSERRRMLFAGAYKLERRTDGDARSGAPRPDAAGPERHERRH